MKTRRIDLRSDALVERLLFDGRRATGVRVLQGGESRDITARKEVVLCAGVFNSPQLLQRSGVGPPDWLANHGLPLVAELPGVGENLRDHCYLAVSARVQNVHTINERAQGLPLALEVLKYLAARRGILALQPSLAYVSWKSGSEVENDDIQLSFAPASYDISRLMRLNSFPGMTCAAWQHRPQSKGTVRARSADPHEAPVIQLNYLAEEEDRRVLLAAVRLARRILQAPEMGPYYEIETNPGAAVQSDDDWHDVMRRQCETSYHPMGTCRMGPRSDPTAVVDDTLKVYGIEGLRVADASIMPDMVSANTNAATLMIGEKAADLILGRPPLAPAGV